MNINLFLYNIDTKQNVCPITDGCTIDPVTIPLHSTIVAVPDKPIQSIRFEYRTINHLEGSAPYSLNGDGVVIVIPNGANSIRLSVYDNKNGNSPPIQPPTLINFTVAAPVLTKMPTKGICGFDSILPAQRPQFVTATGIQGVRLWQQPSQQYAQAVTIGAHTMDTLNWVCANIPNARNVLTYALEGPPANPQPMLPPSPADVVAFWIDQYRQAEPLIDKYGPQALMFSVGNEIDNESPINRYWNPGTQPNGLRMTDIQWRISSYIQQIQKVAYDTLKKASGGKALVVGASITYNPANFIYACHAGYVESCDFGDIHCYPGGSSGWAATFAPCKAAMNGKPLICTEWGGSHGTASSHQAQLMTAGYPSFKDLDAAYYYRTPFTNMHNDPGLYSVHGPAQPIFDAYAKLPTRV